MRFSARFPTGMTFVVLGLVAAQTPSLSLRAQGAITPGDQMGMLRTNADTTAGPGHDLSLVNFMQRVVEYNEVIQARLLAFHAARSQRKAESGTFEPMWVSGGEYQDRKRPNTIEVERSLRSGGFFDERNQSYTSGLEVISPVGTRIRLGTSGRQLINNIQRTVLFDIEAEYETQVGLTLEQPLLKGAGTAVNLAALRLAARSSEVAFQEYRRQLMQVIAESEMGYWQLFYSQQELQLTAESVNVARTLVEDMRAALEAGRGSRLDVLEAEAGMAVRRARQSLARQKNAEAINRITALSGGGGDGGSRRYQALDAPQLRPVEFEPADAVATAQTMSPDFLRAQAQVGQERIRVGYAHNQRLPQVDLKGSFGAQGLGYNWRTSWRDVDRRDFPSWTVALEFRLPLMGGIRGRNELKAAKQRLTQAERTSADIGTQVRTGLDTAQQRLKESYAAAKTFTTVVEFRTTLLDARLKSRAVGRLDTRAVLEAEQDLFASRLDQLQSEIEYQRALLELELVSGTILQNRGIEVEFADLEQQTAAWAEKGGGAVPGLRYIAPGFDRWPAASALLPGGDTAAISPWSIFRPGNGVKK